MTSLRSQALKKLAQLSSDESAQFGVANDGSSTLDMLTHSLPIFYSTNVSKLYTIPLNLNEWDVLYAITSSKVKSLEQAHKLLDDVISVYFVESPRQRFSDVLIMKFKQELLRNPNEISTFQLTRFILSISNSFPELNDKCFSLIEKYLSLVQSLFLIKPSVLFSFLGFLNAVSSSMDDVSIDLSKKTWCSIINIINSSNFFQEIEKVLSSSSDFINDSVVEYFKAGHEISGPLFFEVITSIGLALANTIVFKNMKDIGIDILNDSQMFSRNILQLKHIEYNIDQDPSIATDINITTIDTFNQILKNNAEVLTSLTDFALENAADLDNLDLSTLNRAKYTFNSRANLLQITCLVPFYSSLESKMFEDMTSVVSNYMENILLSGYISPQLIKSIISSVSLLNYYTEEYSSTILRLFPILVASDNITRETVEEVSVTFTLGLQPLNEDTIVNTIYSINNMITVNDNGSPSSLIRERKLTGTISSMPMKGRSLTIDTLDAIKNFSSAHNSHESSPIPGQSLSNATFHGNLFENCISASIVITNNYNVPSITALTTTILTQKFGVISKNLDKIIIKFLAKLVTCVTSAEFSLILKFYRLATQTSAKNDDANLSADIVSAKVFIANQLRKGPKSSEIFKLYLHDLLDSIISSGEVEHKEHRTDTEISKVAEQISSLLRPLSALLPTLDEEPLDLSSDELFTNMFRNIWFNMAIHGFYYNAEFLLPYKKYLLIIAYNTSPLASDFPANKKEISVEMNTVLRRSTSSTIEKKQKNLISGFLSSSTVQSRSPACERIMFLAAAHHLEFLRCDAGDCSKMLLYFSDSSIISSSISRSIDLMNTAITHKYTNSVQLGNLEIFNSKAVAKQLNNIILLLAHKNEMLQNSAFHTCERLIKTVPSSLCRHQSLYTLLDLMTVIFDGVIDCERNRFEPHYIFHLKHSKTKVLLQNSISWRRNALSRLSKSAKSWIKIVMSKCPLDLKMLFHSYLSDFNDYNIEHTVEYGVSFAIEMAGAILPVDRELSRLSLVGNEKPNNIAGFFSQHSWKSKYLVDMVISSSPVDIYKQIGEYAQSIRTCISEKTTIGQDLLNKIFDLSFALIINRTPGSISLIKDLVHIPFEILTGNSMKTGINIWLSIMKEREDLSFYLLSEIGMCWMRSIDNKIGLYSNELDLVKEENQMMEYKEYNKKLINKNISLAESLLKPHRLLINFLSSYFEGSMFQSHSLLKLFNIWILNAVTELKTASLHPYARLVRNELIIFAILVLNANLKRPTKAIPDLSSSIVIGNLSWFKKPLSWPFGADQLRNEADLAVSVELLSKLEHIMPTLSAYCKNESALLKIALKLDIYNMKTWLSPLAKIDKPKTPLSLELLNAAIKIDPQIAYNISQFLNVDKGKSALLSAIVSNPLQFVGVSDVLDLLLSSSSSSKDRNNLHYITYWSPTTPLKSINLLLPPWTTNKYILQYAVYSLESHDVNVTFFYVPQIVQCLRYDKTGYVERLILDTAMISVLFSHQIIWNMLANCYKGDEGLIEDEIKPKLDLVRKRLVAKFSTRHREFYEREFKFFNEVTGISGKLKPYIKKSKAEKKQKIDEEMAKIDVEPGVYLPSNPDGVVVDIARKSGKPLQSHAKAPFMATFKIKREVEPDDSTASLSSNAEGESSKNGNKKLVEKWQAAIFKVGDDCRQDVLALQLISLFRTIWSNIGLDVFVFPYRVTATAPGCGVIDVLPNSISRDMLGREAVNGLFEYFITKFGNETTFEFQNARNNFIKSLAGYSVISYLLQFKDRHNGNIMYDDQGHCLHIDFGFIFDIVPGGVKFEAVPFKLTKEMVNVMGGSKDTAAFKDFEELCIKAYLSARVHMDAIIQCIEPMIGSGLPCFKGSKTIKNLQNRFQPQRTDQEAAVFMKGLIKKSYESLFTKGYDEFQRLTNGIPY
ncbi:hypothetical protein TPHA_0F00400 [Tetrapisispora phaffii CBS 4417]|uniref:1-phosphatidylinositol 4-kinase n=1 Tax=Tetrapisispora phaffii (strain ATCC 24235 / CBS 4417 / NBRC 1672 / NRRL Y-8282 / UCD 70-5) TaxID=1071381 RepID=G8BUU5_TETPH|nr:hypothetical protein TPHA_0F00400 [Tetrapisispora phaffii CBS 4417]CCE63527.1 hypothetical protein TPHA_0F00400 [Tetrapisispora phaffii CBS 4417]